MRLDWWWKPYKGKGPGIDGIDLSGGGGALKTWAGKQLGPRIFQLMKEATAGAAVSLAPFDFSEAVSDSDGSSRDKAISPFYFDSRCEGTSLDIGFSSDEQDMSVEAYPAVESLAMVGLQRFRPVIDASLAFCTFMQQL